MAYIQALGILAFWVAVWGGVGYKLAETYRNRAWFGFWAGLFLGPFGWLLVLVMEDKRAKCPDCRSAFPVGARKCPKCGAALPMIGVAR